MTTILTKTTRAGDVTIAATEYLGRHYASARLGGKWVAMHQTPELLKQAQGEITHALGGSKMAIGLTSAEAELITARLAELNAVVPVDLAAQRRELVATWQGLIDEQEHAYEQAHAREDARAMAIREGYEEAIAEAAAAIEAFDAAHPEVKAALDTERAEAIERNRWV